MKKHREAAPKPGKILAFRNAMGLSQAAMADRIGVALQTWQNWERGRTAPTGLTLKVLRESMEAQGSQSQETAATA